jgi:hypothetical protein
MDAVWVFWHYLQIGFSSQRTLRATLVHLVETSPAGESFDRSRRETKQHDGGNRFVEHDR